MTTDHLRAGVEQVIVAFGTGFLAHPANRSLRKQLRAGRLETQDYLRQLVRLVYRQLFKFIAASRGLSFDPPDLDGYAIAEPHRRAALGALAALDWGTVSVLELGGVYEALLERHAVLDEQARSFRLATAAGHERKTTGSYYTPACLIDCLLDSALDPALDEAARQPDPEGALLLLKVCDPACGSGLFLLAAARRLARRLAAVRAGATEPTPHLLQAALRDVIDRCLFGVDLNPMAVELCRFGLWLEAADPTRPPGILDARIRWGNSLIGATPTLLGEGESADAWCASLVGKAAGCLHWHLAFPDVFRPPAGGFDVVLGNPPWEHAEIKEKEWFAPRRPDIARARTGAGRKHRIAALREEAPALLRAFEEQVHSRAALTRFAVRSGRYPLCGRGRINTYALFAETCRSLIHRAGWVGLVVPSGIATDDTTRPFFRDLVERRALVSLYEFENEGFFAGAGQGHMNRFCLLTLAGPDRSARSPRFLFRGAHVREIADPKRALRLTAADLALFNPNTGTCPIFRTQRDLDLTRDIYRRVPILLRERPSREDPWGITFKQGLFNMAADSALFREREQLVAEGWRLSGNVFRRGLRTCLPLVEAKMLYLFNHRHGDFASVAPGAPCHRLPEPTPAQLADPSYQPLPRYWVAEAAVKERLGDRWPHGWLLGWRDVTDARASARTVIAAVLPRTAVGHKVPLLFPTVDRPSLVACLVANLASFVLDYCARQKVGGTSLTYFYLKQLPVLPPDVYERAAPWSPGETLEEWLLPRVMELTYTSHDLKPFARDCGYAGPPFGWDEERRFQLRCELDAAFFHLYGVGNEEAAYVLETFPVVRRRDERRHGRYRTRDGILAAYGGM